MTPFITLMQNNYGKLMCVYIAIVALVNFVFHIAPIVKVFLAVPMFVFVPLLFGYGFGSILMKFKRESFLFVNSNHILSLVLSWFLGLFSIFVFVFIILLYTQSIVFSLVIVFAGCLYGALKLETDFHTSFQFVRKKTFILCLFLIIMGLFPSFVITQGGATFPLPNTRAWITSGYLHRGVDYVTQGIPVSPYESTHPPALSILYGILAVSFSCSPLEILWVIPFVLTVLLAIGSYLFLFEVSKRSDLAVIGSVVCTWVLSATNHAEYPAAPEGAYVIYALIPFFFYICHKLGQKPETRIRHVLLAFVLGAIFSFGIRLIFMINREWAILETYELGNMYVPLYLLIILSFLLISCVSFRNFLNFGLLIIPIIGLLSIHTVVGLVLSVVGLFYLVTLRLNEKNHSYLTILQVILQVGLLLYVGLQRIGVFKTDITNPFSWLLFLRPVEGYTIDFKFNQLELGAGQFTLVLFLLGLIIMFLSKNKTDKTMLTVTSVILLIYFLPEFWSYRIMDFLAVFISYPVARLIVLIGDKSKFIQNGV